MRTVTEYEWGRERLESYEAHQSPFNEAGQDIIDTEFGDRLSQVPTHKETMDLWDDCDDTALCLIRNVHCAETGNLEDRQWAYVIDGVLTEFDGGAKVPKKYRQEFIKSGLKK